MNTNNPSYMIWQSPNKKWNLALFEFQYVNGDPYENEYSYNEPEKIYFQDFWWLSTNHNTAEEAASSWRTEEISASGALEYVKENYDKITKYEQQAKSFQ